MSEYESGTHTTTSDRRLVYVIFMICVTGTALLYKYEVDGFSRLAMYVTIVVAYAALFMFCAGHYSKKWRRRFTAEQSQPVLPALQLVSTVQSEARFVHRRVATGLFEEGPEQLAHYDHWSR